VVWAESIAASADPANPEPSMRTNRVLTVAFIGFISKVAHPALRERLGGTLVPFDEMRLD
jgi:hypothetical protein